MADLKISALTSATTPLAGTEVLPIVQSGATVKVAISNVTAGRAVSALSYASSAGATFATSSGQLGVGLNPSSWHTVVVKAIELGRAGNAVYGQTNNNTVNVTSNAYFDNAGFKYGTTATASYYSQYDGEHSWWSAPSGTADTAVSFTQRMVLYPTTGNLLLNTGNLVINTAAKGINFTANTPAAGMTSQLLNWYEEGTWTPTQGAGLTVVGAFSSNGKYVKIGKQVTVTGFVAGATSVALAAGTSLAAGLPFTASQTPVDYSLGSATNATNSISTTVLTSGGTVFGTDLIAATPKIYFTITYISV